MAMVDSLLEKARIDRQMRRACIWSAIPMMVLLFGGLTYSGFISPILPSATAEQVAHEYRTNTDAIRLGLAVSFVGVICFLFFGGAITAQVRRIRTIPPVLVYTQIASFASGSLIFIIPWVCWETAAFRPERAATEILLINDLGWMSFVFSYVAFTAWNIAIGLSILADTSTSPVYPRWMGYFNIWIGIIFIPDNVVPFFKSGPFSWNGIFPYWMPFAMYGIWILLMLAATLKTINREAASERAEVRGGGDAHNSIKNPQSDDHRLTAGPTM
jgi:hypothetical protein